MLAFRTATSPARVSSVFWKGGMWWTRGINQLIASYLAGMARHAGVTPNQLSVSNAIVGVATSVGVIATYPVSGLIACCVAMAGWQLAYSLDCADGQLA